MFYLNVHYNVIDLSKNKALISFQERILRFTCDYLYLNEIQYSAGSHSSIIYLE